MTAPHRSEIQVRFGDTDMLGHLNNKAYLEYAELARVELFRDLQGGGPSIILVHLEVDFERQVRFGQRVYLLTWVERVGNTSVTLQQDIYANDDRAAKVRSVSVLFDYQAQAPAAISDELRSRLEGLLLKR